MKISWGKISWGLPAGIDSGTVWSMVDRHVDARVRLQAFEFLEEQTRRSGAVLPRDLLAQGFMFESMRVPLIGPQGIFKPAVASHAMVGGSDVQAHPAPG